MCLLHLNQHGVSVRLNLSTYGGALAEPEYVRMVSLERKSQTCAFFFEHWSKLTHCYKQLDFTVAVWVIFLEYPFLGKVGSDLGGKNLLPRSDGLLSSSEFGEYLTYIIWLSRGFLWEMRHKSTVLEILSELSEDPT